MSPTRQGNVYPSYGTSLQHVSPIDQNTLICLCEGTGKKQIFASRLQYVIKSFTGQEIASLVMETPLTVGGTPEVPGRGALEWPLV